MTIDQLSRADAAFRIVPELLVTSVAAAGPMLVAQFGFCAFGARLVRGDQVIALIAGQAEGHGVIDHVALKAVDTDAAARAVIARGAVVDRSVTPDGPLEIAAFWSGGVRYQFFQGPDGARLELCAVRGVRLADGAALDAGLAGHDHIGLCCADIDASIRFYRALGLQERFSTVLQMPDGALPVCFIGRGTQVLELYSPPARRNVDMPLPPRGHWGGLRFEGTGRSADVVGPDGEAITLA